MDSDNITPQEVEESILYSHLEHLREELDTYIITISDQGIATEELLHHMRLTLHYIEREQGYLS